MSFWSRNEAPSDTAAVLRLYRHDTKLVPDPPLDAHIPHWWRNLAARQPSARVQEALAHWDSIQTVRRELRRSLAHLRQHCRNVELVYAYSTYCLVYTVAYTVNGRQELEYFVGGNPLMPQPKDWLREAWPTVPESIRTFYTLHDGFFDFPSGSGISPQRWVRRLSDDDWGIIDTLDEPVRINLRTSFNFVSNGAGGQVVVDLDDYVDGKATLWWATDPPDYDQSFWDVADEWLLMFLSEP
ncbi:MAG: hypothetical protein FWF75_10680 [Propionibacteriaceae bacterium]|nr:hypothetical protein [Propionibacteriaceae bacterium]